MRTGLEAAFMQSNAQPDQVSSTPESSKPPADFKDILEDEDVVLEEDDVKRLPYLKDEILGSGGAAVVQRVQHTKTKALYAIKTIRFPWESHQRIETEKHFDSEVEITRSLKGHYHIVRVFATFKTADHGNIILQPVAIDGDLEMFLRRYERLFEQHETHVREITAIVPVLQRAFGCLASGLEYMHGKQIRHRDIKPRNILIHQGRVLYADFGASKDARRPGESTTEGSAMPLTRKWAPPEVLDSTKRNYSADVYSLGCVFITLFATITRAINLDHGERFRDIMEKTHADLRAAKVSPLLSFLPEIIIAMTWRDRLKRPPASTVFRIIHEHDEFYCSKCHRPKGLYTEWIWHERLRRWYCFELAGDGSPTIDRPYWDDPATQHKPPPKIAHTGSGQSSQKPQPPAVDEISREMSETRIAEDFLSPLDPPAQRISTEPASAALESSYQRLGKESQPGFFVLGRVFKMLWTASPNIPGEERSRASSQHSFEPQKNGEDAETRTFVVVRNMGNSSQCVPVQSFRRRGHGTTPSFLTDNHGIIFTAAQPPTVSSPEERNLAKRAVQVRLREGIRADVLRPESRLNYGKRYSVLHNVKVVDIGMIVDEHKHLVEAYSDTTING
ncbi:kinase-like protein [Setomelanomma holmii]|uniref:non-specific serine/threonine protein kinase n=1 Tax=Setomelanomma holmii TaxID=210430 RepID=A0A9P4HCA8_9PLEO|nr:kinase-like protein [Setomelanomma holmii]